MSLFYPFPSTAPYIISVNGEADVMIYGHPLQLGYLYQTSRRVLLYRHPPLCHYSLVRTGVVSA